MPYIRKLIDSSGKAFYPITTSDAVAVATNKSLKTKLSEIEAQISGIATPTRVKGSAETVYRTGDVNLTPTNLGLGNVDNTHDNAKNVLSATKLTTPRSLKTKLDSTTAVTFDGSGAQDAIPVTGTLPLTNGGTGATTAAAARTNLGLGNVENIKQLHLYAATLTVAAWKGDDSAGYTQTATCTTQDGGPAVTATMQFGIPMARPTGVRETDSALRDALQIVNSGVVTPGAGNVTVKVWEKPASDIQVFWYAR